MNRRWPIIGFVAVVCVSMGAFFFESVLVSDWLRLEGQFGSNTSNITLHCVEKDSNAKLTNNDTVSRIQLLKKISDVSYDLVMQHPALEGLAAFQHSDHIAVILSSMVPTGSRVFCRYFDQYGSLLKPAFEATIFPRYVAHCENRIGATRIGLSSHPAMGFVEQLLIVARPAEPTHWLGICLAPIYGEEPKWLHIVELIEHYKLQGATYIFFYIEELDEFGKWFVKSYIDSKEAEVVRMPTVSRNVITQQLFAISDCLSRSRKVTKWAIFADLDERLIMTDPGVTIAGFLKTVDNSIGEVSFPQRWILKSAWLPTNFWSEAQVSFIIISCTFSSFALPHPTEMSQLFAEMPTIRYTNTSAAATQNISCVEPSCWAKSIIDPEKVASMSVHNVEHFLPGYRRLWLPPQTGYIRHYRDVNMGNWGRNNQKLLAEFGNFTTTFYPAPLLEKLKANVLQRVKIVSEKGKALLPKKTTTNSPKR